MKCARCGKKLGFFEKKKKVFIQGEDGESDLKVKERVFCFPCFEQYIKELESRKSCFDCAYSELREDYYLGLIFRLAYISIVKNRYLTSA